MWGCVPVADYNLAIEICNVASQIDFQIVLESFLGDDPPDVLFNATLALLPRWSIHLVP